MKWKHLLPVFWMEKEASEITTLPQSKKKYKSNFELFFFCIKKSKIYTRIVLINAHSLMFENFQVLSFTIEFGIMNSTWCWKVNLSKCFFTLYKNHFKLWATPATSKYFKKMEMWVLYIQTLTITRLFL